MRPYLEESKFKPHIVDCSNEGVFSIFELDESSLPSRASPFATVRAGKSDSADDRMMLSPKVLRNLDCSASTSSLNSAVVHPEEISVSSRRGSSTSQSSLSLASRRDSSTSLWSASMDDESFASWNDSGLFDKDSHGRWFCGNKKRRRSISFHPRIQVRSIPHLSNLSEEERTQIWYQDHELGEIKKEATKTLRLAKKGAMLDEKEYCLRGLGSKSRLGQRRRCSWVMALSCVLDEQDRQQRLGVSDPERMATLYRSFANPSVQAAIMHAQEDAKHLGKY